MSPSPRYRVDDWSTLEPGDRVIAVPTNDPDGKGVSGRVNAYIRGNAGSDRDSHEVTITVDGISESYYSHGYVIYRNIQ